MGEVASLGRRAMALVVDWVASLLVVTVVYADFRTGAAGSSLLPLAVFYGEVVILTWLIGASFGQRILGLRVERTDGSRLSLPRVALRTALICLVIPAVVYDSEGRGLHDRAVDSVVVRVGRSRTTS